MQRRALIVDGAVGQAVEATEEVLQRFGFAGSQTSPSLDEAVSRLRDEHADLLLVPLSAANAMDLATLERTVRQREGLFVIGTAPRPDSELILSAMRAGVHEFLVSPPDPRELAAALDRLLRRSERELHQGSTIAVYSAKGGLGTTTLAVNIAFALAKYQAKSRVALVDFVVSGGDLRLMLNLKSAYDIGDLMARMQRIDAELLTSILTPLDHGVWALPAAERPEVAELVDAGAAATIIGQLRTHFGFTVLDCEHHLTERTLAALDLADQILLVTQLNVAALRSTQRTLELAQRLGYGNDKLRVVVNRYQGSDVVSLRDAADLLDRPVFHSLPNDYKSALASQTRGVTVAAHDPSSKLAESYAGLAAKLSGSPTAPLNGKGAPSGSRIGRFLGFGKR
jgi:pilus assembly protein CpaE